MLRFGFLVELLCLTYGKEVIKLETFTMAASMASVQQIVLALTMLSYIHHSLGKAANHPNHPSKANTIFASHYVIG